MMKQLLLTFLICMGMASAQDLTAPRSGGVDFTNAGHTASIKSGLASAAPVTCFANKDIYLQTDTHQITVCNSSGNGWIVATGGGSSLFTDASAAAGGSVGAKIDSACTSLGGANGIVMIPASMGAGWSINGIPTNCTIIDQRGNGGSTQTAFARGLDFYGRYTSVGSSLQIISPLMCEMDAYAGGVNTYPGAPAQKTQWQCLRIQMIGRTIGERKGAEINTSTYAFGDSIGIMATSYDFGGYGTGGDEGSIGGRFQSVQGDPGVSDGNYPRGTVSAISGNLLTGSWTGGSNANLGELRWVINTSRGVYNTGSLTGATGAPCVVTGSGTTWLPLAPGGVAGDVNDLFMEVTSFTGGTGAKWVVPVLHVTDNTHLIIEYNLNELNATCPGGVSGSYNIFRGGRVATLAAPVASSPNPTAVNLAAGGADFQVGDTIQQPMGYNFHPEGVAAFVGRLMGGSTLGSAVRAGNLFTNEVQNAFRGTGNFQNGILLDSGNLSVSALRVLEPAGSLLRMEDISASNQALISIFNSGLTLRSISFDRTNELWDLNALKISANDGRVGQGTLPQANMAYYMFYNNAAWSGLIVAPSATPNANVPIFDTQVAGASRLRVENTKLLINNAMDVVGNAANLATQNWGVTGSTGAGRFDGGVVTKADININPTTGSARLLISPTAGAKSYSIYAGSSGDFDGWLRIFNSSIGTVAGFTGSAVSGWHFENSVTVSGWSDAGSTRTWLLDTANGEASLTGGVKFTAPVGNGGFLHSSDQTSAVQVVLQMLSTGASTRNWISVDRVNDVFSTGGGLFQADGFDTRTSIGGSTPQANTALYVGYTTTTWNGLVIGAPTSLGNNLAALDVRVGSFTAFRVENTQTIFNNGQNIIGYSSNLTLQNWGVTGSTGQGRFDGGLNAGLNPVTFSATPTFDATKGNTQKITLTANVTSSTLTIPAAGQPLTFIICQDATGGRTLVWPSNVKGAMTIGTIASTCSVQTFASDGTNIYATSPGLANEN